MNTGEVQVEEALLEGHLGVTKELLTFQAPDKKYHIGSEKGGNNLIKVRAKLELLLNSSCVIGSWGLSISMNVQSTLLQEMVEDFIFPASKIVIQCRKSQREIYHQTKQYLYVLRHLP